MSSKVKMPALQITHSANAGCALLFDDTRLLIDPFPMESVGGFSALTEDKLKTLIFHPDFARADGIFVTHRHKDHCSVPALQRYLAQWPDTRLFLGETMPALGGVVLREDCFFSLGNISIHFLKLPHGGWRYADVPHFGCLLCSRERNLLVPADCELASPVLAEKLGERMIDTVLLTFPWVSLRNGIDYTENVLRPKHILVNHLRDRDDKGFDYEKYARRYSGRITCTDDIRFLDRFLQTETF